MEIINTNGQNEQNVNVSRTEQYNRVQEFEKTYFNWIPHIVAAVFTCGLSLPYSLYVRDKKMKLARNLGIAENQSIPLRDKISKKS